MGSSIRSDQQLLDYYTAKTGLGPAEAASNLMALRAASPAAFASLVNEAREAYAASPEGSAALGQGGVGAPKGQGEVLAEGRQSVAGIAKEGIQMVGVNAEVNKAEVAGHQHAAPDSNPNAAPVQTQFSAISGQVDALHQAQGKHVDLQRGVSQLTQQAVAGQHGALTSVQIAFAGWTLDSPKEIEARMQYVVQNDPAVAAQVAHLGTLPAPTDRQLAGTAEMVKASYDKLTR